MRQLGTEEKAALLLTSADDDDHHPASSHDNITVVPKRRKTYHRRPASNSSSIVVFVLILSAFVFGCLSGVVIMLYRFSQDAEHSSSFVASSHLTRVDPTIKAKLFQSITKTNFLNLTRGIESETDAASRLEQTWQSASSKVFTRVNKLSYDLTLSTYAPSTQWSGIQVLEGKADGEIKRYSLSSTNNEYLTFSSLIKSGRVQANYIYFANYGRQEDFAYLIKKNQIQFEHNDKTIIFMRRKATVISQTEQIRQASRYGFAGLVLFDDGQEHAQVNATNDRQSFADEWERRSSGRERQQFLDGTLSQDDRQSVVLILSYTDVQSIFSSDSNDWFPCPAEWHDANTPLKIGGLLPKTKLRLTTFMQEVPVHLPVVLGYLRGTTDADRFVMIGYQLGRKQQEKVLNEIIRAYEQQMKEGWQPRRSIVFCAWSGLAYDRHTIRQWLSDNYRLLDQNLIAYIDLGNGIVGNSTLSLHGSPLLQQVAQRAADSVVSPLVHDHACHRRQPQMPMSHEHTHGRRRRRHGGDHGSGMHMDQADQGTECEPHKLLDEWLRASKNRIDANRTTNIVQIMDGDSSAALFQLKHGIPSLLIEMTDEQALTKDTFYARNSPAVFNNEIQPEVVVAYTQFVSEILRQLVDEPLIPFNVTDYAVLIEKQTADYITRYQKEYRSLATHLDDSDAMKKLVDDLTKAIRELQSRIDQTSKNNYMDLQILNDKLIEFERLFIFDDQSRRTATIDDAYRHVLTGPAFGLTNTVVPFPLLSNLLFGIGNDPQTELRDASKVYWMKVKQHIQLMTRTLRGFDGLLANA